MDYKAAADYWIEKDKRSVKMSREELFSEIESFLKKHKVCALATGAGDFVRCTPIEYNYIDGCFYLFSEGGLKFRALEENMHVCLAWYMHVSCAWHIHMSFAWHMHVLHVCLAPYKPMILPP